RSVGRACAAIDNQALVLEDFFQGQTGLDKGDRRLRRHSGVVRADFVYDYVGCVDQREVDGSQIGMPLLGRYWMPGLKRDQPVEERRLGEVLEFELRVAARIAVRDALLVGRLVELREHESRVERSG